jgi:hypothetical protein
MPKKDEKVTKANRGDRRSSANGGASKTPHVETAKNGGKGGTGKKSGGSKKSK